MGCKIVSKLNYRELELSWLELLLSQHIFLIGKRGKWWDRRCLVQQEHIRKDKSIQSKRQSALLAYELCQMALKDIHVRIGSRFANEKKKNRIERQYFNSKKEKLGNKPSKIVISGKFYLLFFLIKKKMQKCNKMVKIFEINFSFVSYFDFILGKKTSNGSVPGKSTWAVPDGPDVTVEEYALRYYQSDEGENFDGIHSENSIVTTLFSLLFWDILFSDVLGVFESQYQGNLLLINYLLQLSFTIISNFFL